MQTMRTELATSARAVYVGKLRVFFVAPVGCFELPTSQTSFRVLGFVIYRLPLLDADGSALRVSTAEVRAAL